MSCMSETAKYVLFIFNALVAACAIVLIIFGIEFYIDETAGVNIFSNISDIFSLGILAMSVGVIMLFIAGFGFLGALHQNTCLLTLYAIILIILFVLELFLGVMGLVKILDDAEFFKYVRDSIQDLFNDQESYETFLDLQIQFECCGVNKYTDYNLTSSGYPSSCCAKLVTPCFQPYEGGCANAFADSMHLYIEILSWVAIGFAVVELGMAVFSFLLRREHLQNELKFTGHKVEETDI